MKRSLLPAACLALGLMAATSGRAEIIEALDRAPEPQVTGEITRFCTNIADAARDRRHALQTAELKQLQGEIDRRMERLDEKRAEYEAWLARRDAFAEMAQKAVVDIYARMRPDAAAERMAALDPELTAAILMKLDSRLSSVILNEMELKAAATVTSIMASAARKEDPS